MTQKQRSLAFLCTLLLTFGISSLNFEHLEYYNNEKSYIVIGLGLISLVAFIIMKIRN